MDPLPLTRVLIADPDEPLLTVYRELLRKEFDVVTASDGLKCLARLRERAPDVLVLEPQLPWGGGDGVLAAMRDESDLANVLVMILTECRDRHVLESVAPFAISDYCVKPLSPAHLTTRIRTVLAFRPARAARNAGSQALKIAMIEKESVSS